VQTGNSEVRAGGGRNIGEVRSLVSENAVGLWVIGVQSAAGDEYIQAAIVVQIDEATAPPAPGAAKVEQVATGAGIVESTLAVVAE
jgi:hypothetical protein